MKTGLEDVFKLPEDNYFMQHMRSIKSYPIPAESMPVEEAMEVLPRFLSLPDTISTAK